MALLSIGDKHPASFPRVNAGTSAQEQTCASGYLAYWSLCVCQIYPLRINIVKNSNWGLFNPK